MTRPDQGYLDALERKRKIEYRFQMAGIIIAAVLKLSVVIAIVAIAIKFWM